MKPLDPRLLRQARAARRYVVLTTGLGVATTALLVVQSLLLARIIAGVAMDGESLADVRAQVVVLGIVLAARAVIAGAQERFGHRAATAVVRQLRERLIDHATRELGAGQRVPGNENGTENGEGGVTPSGAPLALLATRGLDALDGYLTRYLPQLLLSATLTPAVLVVIWWEDWIAGLTILLTLPLIPLFMALIGMVSQSEADRGLASLQRLGTQVLDLIAGLPTLRALGTASHQAERVRVAGDAHRRATMKTLRTAFLSALVLEVLVTLSVALVAVGIGLRLVHGSLGLHTGLAVLLLAPEVYLPLRTVGTHFHASVDGLAAAQQAFDVLERPVPVRGTVPAPDLARTTISLDAVSVRHDGVPTPTPDRLSAGLAPGEIVALTGPSGSGKSTAVAVLLGLRAPDSGAVVLSDSGAVTLSGAEPVTLSGAGPVSLADVEPESWWRQIAWCPQHPVLVPGTLHENVRLLCPSATDAQIAEAARVTKFDDVVSTVPGGWSGRVGQGGTGLSAGQRQRLALTRLLLSDAPLVVLDEPTAHLDAGSERAVLDLLTELRRRGRTVVMVAHRPALVAAADRTIDVSGHTVAGLETGSQMEVPA
ncbi:thiol reductant ABC exporter subunit CydD [Kineosporia sp. J2-2]|uniref:Thiol reductant ABC exporter subunit CydD n=1 Tax=Kineosporia corallincola TaxID=2835133 RepID=A0ABS5TDG9_9ACTN|nr:thiol reductant ABC exporter subunit CydD [Kineosporia corallincola]MBT0769140.1 thiol reductant ABC exporter subunit CydD [Kineosporia corallincola]